MSEQPLQQSPSFWSIPGVAEADPAMPPPPAGADVTALVQSMALEASIERAPAMPAFADTAMADDPADAASASEADSGAAVGSGSEWWSPATALVAAMAALALGLVSVYAAHRLPAREQSGGTLDRFDTIVGAAPLVDGIAGTILTILLAAAALGILRAGAQRGVRDRFVQGVVAAIACASIAVAALAPILI